MLAQFILLAASPPSAETCTPVPRAFFPPLSLFYVFFSLFFFLNASGEEFLFPPLPFHSKEPPCSSLKRWDCFAPVPEGRANLCLHMCMCKIDPKMSMNSRKSSGRPSYYYRLLRRSRLQRQRSRSRSRNRLSRGNCNHSSL